MCNPLVRLQVFSTRANLGIEMVLQLGLYQLMPLAEGRARIELVCLLEADVVAAGSMARRR